MTPEEKKARAYWMKRFLENAGQTHEAVDKATDMSKESGGALSEIVSLVSAGASQVSSIAAASERQSATGGQIAGSVNEVADIAADTSRQTHDSMQTVKRLAELARRLHTTVEAKA